MKKETIVTILTECSNVHTHEKSRVEKFQASRNGLHQVSKEFYLFLDIYIH